MRLNRAWPQRSRGAWALRVRARRDLSSAFLLRLPVLLTARLSSCSAAPAFPTDRPQFCRPVTRPHLGFFAPKIPPRDSDLLSSQPFIFRPFAHDTATPRVPLSSHGHPTLPGSQPSFVTYRARLLASSRYPTPLALFLSSLMSLHDRQPTRLSSTRERQWFVYGHRHKYANHKLEYRILISF